MPQRGHFDEHAVFALQPLTQLRKRQVRLLPDPFPERPLQRGHPRNAVAAHAQTAAPRLLYKGPPHFTDPPPAHLKAPGDGGEFFALFQRPENPVAQIL